MTEEIHKSDQDDLGGQASSGDDRRTRLRLSGPTGRTLATSLAAQALLFVTGVVAARALGVDGRGDFALLWVGPLAVATLGGIGLPQATAYFTAQASHPSDRLGVIRTSLRIALPIATLASAVYVTVGLILVPGDSPMRTPFLISTGLVPLILFQYLGVGILQGMREFDRYNVARVMPLALYAPLAASAFFLGVATVTSMIALFVAAFIAASVQTWLMVGRLNREGKSECNRFPARRLVTFGIRGLLGDGHPSEQVRLDQLVVGLLVDVRALGLYASAASFSYLSRFVAQSLGAVAFPRIASAPRDEEKWRILTRALFLGAIGVVFVTAALEVLLPYLVELFFGEAFLGAVPIGRILLVAGALFGLKRLLTDLARGLGHPGYGSLAELVGVVVFAAATGTLAITDQTTAEGIAWAVTLGGFSSLVFLAISLGRIGPRSLV